MGTKVTVGTRGDIGDKIPKIGKKNFELLAYLSMHPNLQVI